MNTKRISVWPDTEECTGHRVIGDGLQDFGLMDGDIAVLTPVKSSESKIKKEPCYEIEDGSIYLIELCSRKFFARLYRTRRGQYITLYEAGEKTGREIPRGFVKPLGKLIGLTRQFQPMQAPEQVPASI